MGTDSVKEFVVGDVVRLKSGGPEMTVTYLSGTEDRPRVVVMHFDGKTAHVKEIPMAALIYARVKDADR